MKIIKKVLMTAMLFSIYANNIYATTAGSYVAKESTSVNKVILLLVGVGLVSLVLFLGYKLDKNEASEERKEKFNKKERDLEDVYDSVYTSKTDISRELDKIEISEEDLDIIDDNEIFEDEESLLTEAAIAEELEKMAIEEAIKEAKYNLENDLEVEEDYEDDEIEEDEDDDEDDDDVEEYEEEDEEVIAYNPTDVIIDDEKPRGMYIGGKGALNSTMVFETDKLRKIEEKLNRTVDYDQEDDLDLSELEGTIKAANIKKYTRKKPAKKDSKKTKENKKDENVKRFTRKKVKQIVEEVVEEVKKPRRGRPTKAEAEEKARIAALNVQKPRRGRPPKKDKPKRGRPPKKVTEKAKRGRPSKKK